MATLGLVEDHVTPGVTSTDVPPEVFPVATNWVVPPTVKVGLVGESVSETTVLFETKNPPPHAVRDTVTKIAQAARMP